MADEAYVMQYPDGCWVKRDDSTGPMSSGGYPYRVDDLREATQWDTLDAALKYMGVLSEPWTVHLLRFTTVPVVVSPADMARATGDDEYLEFLRLKRKYGEVDEKCPFDKPWQGKCGKTPDVGEIYCSEHKGEKCFKCGAQATRGCDWAGQFVCGVPMCDQHKHH